MDPRFTTVDPQIALLMEEQRRIDDLRRRGLLPEETIQAVRGLGAPTPTSPAAPPSLAAAMGSGPTVPALQGGLLTPRESAPTQRGGLLGGVDRLYSAVDPYLPGDGLLDPMFNGGSQPRGLLAGGGQGAGGAGGEGFGFQSPRLNPLRVADKVFGIGVGSAIDSERSRAAGLELRKQIGRIGMDESLDEAAKLSAMRDLVRQAEAAGIDVGQWHSALDSIDDKLKRKKFVDGLPGEARPEAEIDLPGWLTENRLRTRPQYFNSDNPVVSVNPGQVGPDGLPDVRTLFPGITKPAELTTDKVTARVVQQALEQGIESLTPAQRQIYDRHINGTGGEGGGPPGTDKVIAGIILKRINGEQTNAAEDEAYQEWLSRGGSEDLISLLIARELGRDGGQPTGGPPPHPKNKPAAPRNQADYNALPVGSWFINPSDKRLVQKTEE